MVNKKVKDWIEVTEVRNESFNVVTTAGMGIQKKDKIGYEIWDELMAMIRDILNS